MITGINKLKNSTKHIPCKCKFDFDSRKCYPNMSMSICQDQCECRNLKDYDVFKKIILESRHMY